MRVLLTPQAQEEFESLQPVIRERVRAVILRLEEWPHVSGVKRLRGSWAGSYRLRTGDYRVVFRIMEGNAVILRIQHRADVYEE